MRIVAITVALASLAACASPQERETRIVGAAHQRCALAGFQTGSQARAQCVAYTMASIDASQQRAAAALLGYGAAMTQPRQPYVVNVAPMTCTRVIPGTVRCH